MLSPGDRFEGYLVDGIVGHGGSATVYRAHEAAARGVRLPPRLSHRINWPPRAFDSILAKATNPRDRYQSCSELIELNARVVRDWDANPPLPLRNPTFTGLFGVTARDPISER